MEELLQVVPPPFQHTCPKNSDLVNSLASRYVTTVKISTLHIRVLVGG